MENFDVNRFIAGINEDEEWVMESIGSCPDCGCDLELVLENGLYCKCMNPECMYREYEGKKNTNQRVKDTNLMEYTEWLRKQNISDNAINTYVSGARKYIQFLHSQGQLPPPPNGKSGRDHTKYIFNGHIAKKSPMFYFVLKYYVEKHPEKTLKDLEQNFPKWICPSVLFKRWTDVTPNQQKCFRKDPVILGNGTKIALTNQWTTDSFEKFRRQAKNFGLNIEIYEEYPPPC